MEGSPRQAARCPHSGIAAPAPSHPHTRAPVRPASVASGQTHPIAALLHSGPRPNLGQFQDVLPSELAKAAAEREENKLAGVQPCSLEEEAGGLGKAKQDEQAAGETAAAAAVAHWQAGAPSTAAGCGEDGGAAGRIRGKSRLRLRSSLAGSSGGAAGEGSASTAAATAVTSLAAAPTSQERTSRWRSSRPLAAAGPPPAGDRSSLLGPLGPNSAVLDPGCGERKSWRPSAPGGGCGGSTRALSGLSTLSEKQPLEEEEDAGRGQHCRQRQRWRQ
jgi:hypothetical protein